MSSADQASIKATVLRLLDAQGPDDMRFSRELTHPSFTLSDDRLIATKTAGGSWNSALCVGEDKSGRHFMTFRVLTVGSPHSDLHFGVTPFRHYDYHIGQGNTPQVLPHCLELDQALMCFDCFSQEKGVMFHSPTGTIYKERKHEPFLEKPAFHGAMIGVLLDMNAKTVTFYFNGFTSDKATHPIVGDAFSFGVSIHHGWESVEVIPSKCWHKD